MCGDKGGFEYRSLFGCACTKGDECLIGVYPTVEFCVWLLEVSFQVGVENILVFWENVVA